MKELFGALAKARGEMSAPKKTSTNPHFKSKYAPLDEVVDCSAGPLAKYGLVVVQIPKIVDGAMVLHTQITHASGEALDCGYYALQPGRGSVQDMGSAITYARRYSLAAILGLAAEEDDDGNATASFSPPKQQAAKYKAAVTPEPRTAAHDMSEQLRQATEEKRLESAAQIQASLEKPKTDALREHCAKMWYDEPILQGCFDDPNTDDAAYGTMRAEVKRLMGVKSVAEFLAVKSYVFAGAVEQDRQ